MLYPLFFITTYNQFKLLNERPMFSAAPQTRAPPRIPPKANTPWASSGAFRKQQPSEAETPQTALPSIKIEPIVIAEKEPSRYQTRPAAEGRERVVAPASAPSNSWLTNLKRHTQDQSSILHMNSGPIVKKKVESENPKIECSLILELGCVGWQRDTERGEERIDEREHKG
ncbi:preprotein translocase subunit SecG domain protein [Teladorsagia circumcincta]|uniref:Preprotein translocase subunit SecG domain protein n=1 Tax=Teladorsagia circumcincta TaxID=45464 RepID=A0A2G9UKE5_TELCI|nr:preprotein translocase subunit SecG domain protein [Teladorsagia circumcincta]